MVNIKICGFTRRQDIDDAVGLGVKIIGVNFFPGSLRFVGEIEARKLLEGLPGDVLKIGVFVNPEEKNLLYAVKALNLGGVQLHGDETPYFVKKIKERLSGEKIIIKALRVKNKEIWEEIKKYEPDYYLLDAYKNNMLGGTGIKIEYGYLENRDLPWGRIFIAGGISPDNVAEITRRFRPYGLDIASGVETYPGIKDRDKMNRLIQNAKESENNVT